MLKCAEQPLRDYVVLASTSLVPQSVVTNNHMSSCSSTSSSSCSLVLHAHTITPTRVVLSHTALEDAKIHEGTRRDESKELPMSYQ